MTNVARALARARCTQGARGHRDRGLRGARIRFGVSADARGFETHLLAILKGARLPITGE